MRKSRLEKHNRTMKRLQRKKEIAELKREEWLLKYDILKTYLPFLGKTTKFNKLIVSISIAAIILYTIAAILLQKFIAIEISPTLTTCVFAFFGTELLALSGIKMFDTKFGADNYLD